MTKGAPCLLGLALVQGSPTATRAEPGPEIANSAITRAAESGTFEDEARELPSATCLANTICDLKNKIRWRTPAWTPEFCQTIANGVLESAKRHDVSPSLVLAVMVNESDMNEKAYLDSIRDGKVYARDGGLMGLRCIVDAKGICTNGYVRGVPWKKLMDPLTNIEQGTRQLALWRTGGLARKMVNVRDKSGRVVAKEKYVTCQHKTHAYWAHYNHGPFYIAKGTARHYPHRVAVLYHAIARSMDLATPELANQRITIRDPGMRERTVDRPVEPRYRKLTAQIAEAGGLCSNVASLPAPSHTH